MPTADFSSGGISRRDFLQISAAGSLLLGAAGSLALLAGCERRPDVARGYKVLRPQDLPMLSRLLPAALAGALPDATEARALAVEQALASFDQLLCDTSPPVRAQFTQLLDLLNLGIARALLLGLWSGWENASEEDAAAVLDRLAGSSIGLLRGIYNGLATMSMMAWYLEPAHQAASGYPGPPRKIVIDQPA